MLFWIRVSIVYLLKLIILQSQKLFVYPNLFMGRPYRILWKLNVEQIGKYNYYSITQCNWIIRMKASPRLLYEWELGTHAFRYWMVVFMQNTYYLRGIREIRYHENGVCYVMQQYSRKVLNKNVTSTLWSIMITIFIDS